MNWRHETAKMGVELATAGARPRGILDSTSQGPWPEDAWKDGHIRGRSHALS
jgi:hypothetical protein